MSQEKHIGMRNIQKLKYLIACSTPNTLPRISTSSTIGWPKQAI